MDLLWRRPVRRRGEGEREREREEDERNNEDEAGISRGPPGV